MDNILTLFSEMVVDLQGFDETQFGIFHQDDYQELIHIWFNVVKKNPNKFFSMLSPAQKKDVAAWAVHRTCIPTVSLIETMENFITCLRSTDSPVYPPKRSQSAGLPEKPRKIKGWKKLVYTAQV